jgi:hypothetical protein
MKIFTCQNCPKNLILMDLHVFKKFSYSRKMLVKNNCSKIIVRIRKEKMQIGKMTGKIKLKLYFC